MKNKKIKADFTVEELEDRLESISVSTYLTPQDAGVGCCSGGGGCDFGCSTSCDGVGPQGAFPDPSSGSGSCNAYRDAACPMSLGISTFHYVH